MGSSDSNVWHQVHAQREDGVAAMFLIRDVVPRPDQPKIFVVELPYPVTDLSGQPDAAGYRRLGAFQDQWLEPACAALGWTFVAWKCEDGSFFLYLYGSGDPEALLDKLAPFDGELGFFNDLDADWSEYAALRELVEQAEAAEDDHAHGDGYEHDHPDHIHGEGCEDHHAHGDGCEHDHPDHVHGEGGEHDHPDHVHGEDGRGDHRAGSNPAGHAIEVIDLTGETPIRTWGRPTDVATGDPVDDAAAPAEASELAAIGEPPARTRRDTAPRITGKRRAAAPASRAREDDDAAPAPRRGRGAARRPPAASRPSAKSPARATPARSRPSTKAAARATPAPRPARRSRRAAASSAPTSGKRPRRRAAAAAKSPAKRTAAASAKAARPRATREASAPASVRSASSASRQRGGARTAPAKRAAATTAPARATRRRRAR